MNPCDYVVMDVEEAADLVEQERQVVEPGRQVVEPERQVVEPERQVVEHWELLQFLMAEAEVVLLGNLVG